MNQLVIYAMTFYVFYIFGLLIYNFQLRMRALRAGRVRTSHFRTYTSDNYPEDLLISGRHLDNQFQLPMLFLITAGLYLSLDLVNVLTVVCVWGFVLSRILHSYIHLGSNHVVRRAQAYAVGWVLILLLWGQLPFVLRS